MNGHQTDFNTSYLITPEDVVSVVHSDAPGFRLHASYDAAYPPLSTDCHIANPEHYVWRDSPLFARTVGGTSDREVLVEPVDRGVSLRVAGDETSVVDYQPRFGAVRGLHPRDRPT